MNKKNLVKIINKELTILTDIVSDFSNDGEIHPFEVDLALSKIKDIYGELLLLKDTRQNIETTVQQELDGVKTQKPIEKSGKQHEVEEKVELKPESESVSDNLDEKQEEIIEESNDTEIENETLEEAEEVIDKIKEPVEEEIKAEIQLDESEADIKADEPEVEQEVEEKPYIIESFTPKEVKSEEKNEIVKEERQDIEIPKEEAKTSENKTSKSKTASSIVADKFQNNSPSLNDMLAGIKKNKDIASAIKDSPIKDLKSAIKLNDRIWYTNELFKKDASQFESAVAQINQMTDLDSALAYIFTNYQWDQNQKSTISFLELVFRRFATN